MVKNNLVVLVAIILAGCATTQPIEPTIKIVTQQVEVPIAVPCKAEMPKKPSFNFDKLDTKASVFDKTKAVLADRKLHAAYQNELVVALASCTKDSSTAQ